MSDDDPIGDMIVVQQVTAGLAAEPDDVASLGTEARGAYILGCPAPRTM